MSRPPLRAFVASTVTDLKEYRTAVQDALSRLGIDMVSLDAATLRAEPAAELAERAVFEELAASDVVVLVIGHRYGSPAPHGRKSWVEAEYEAAARLGKPILVFLASDKAAWPPDAIDTDRSRIDAFRRELRSRYLVSDFESPVGLVSGLVSAFTRLRIRHRESPAVTHVSPEERQSPELKNVRVVRLLLSSPGDVAAERDACSRAVFRFNQQEVEGRGIFIKLVRWEDMAPQIGPGAQEVINQQLGRHDLFCGIMWNRFGTPTDVAASGTEEEFRGALATWRATQRPWITFYFCERPANFANAQQLDQKRRVLEFRAELQDLGIVRCYTTVEEFENSVFIDPAPDHQLFHVQPERERSVGSACTERPNESLQLTERASAPLGSTDHAARSAAELGC